MGTPAGYTGNGEQRGEQILADAQHAVDQAAEQVHIGADLFGAVLFLSKDLRGQPLDAAQHLVFLIVAFFICKALGVGLENLGARVAQCVNRVAHAVN